MTDRDQLLEQAVAAYRQDRGYGEGEWGEYLCEVLERITADPPILDVRPESEIE